MLSGSQNLLAEAGITERDKKILQRFYHPETVAVVKDLFRKKDESGVSVQVVYRRLDKLCEMKRLYKVGHLPCSKGKKGYGRGAEVYSTWKVTHVEHEVQLSRILRHWNLNARRGKDVGRKKPDAEIGSLCVEMDRDTEAWPQVKRRLSVYQDGKETVMFVTVNERRRDDVLKRCDFLSDGLLACTVEEAFRWVAFDTEGKQWALKKVFQNLLK